MLVIQLLTAFGIGSIVSLLIQWLLTNYSEIKKRNFHEKKEAYLGLLKAYHQAIVHGGVDATKECAYWDIRCSLVSPPKVRNTIKLIYGKKIAGPILEELQNVMREDLGVTKI